MPRRTSHEIVLQIKKVLEKESDLSVHQIARKIKSQWRIANNNLEFMKSIGIVEEIATKNKKKEGRRFRLVKK